MNTKIEQLEREYLELKEKLAIIDNERKPIQKRFTYIRNRISTINLRESNKKVK